MTNGTKSLTRFNDTDGAPALLKTVPPPGATDVNRRVVQVEYHFSEPVVANRSEGQVAVQS